MWDMTVTQGIQVTLNGSGTTSLFPPHPDDMSSSKEYSTNIYRESRTWAFLKKEERKEKERAASVEHSPHLFLTSFQGGEKWVEQEIRIHL